MDDGSANALEADVGAQEDPVVGETGAESASDEPQPSKDGEDSASVSVEAKEDDKHPDLSEPEKDDDDVEEGEKKDGEDHGVEPLPLGQPSQETLMGTQLSQADSIFEDSQPRVWAPPAGGHGRDSDDSSMEDDDAPMSQESETPTVLGTQNMTQEWMTQPDEDM